MDPADSSSGRAPMVELEQVSKSFDGGSTFAIRSLNLKVLTGEFVAIVGGSGSGKTTALKTINRLLDADCGSIRVAGESIAAIPGHVLRRRIGYVFQGIGLFPHLTVAENIGITARLLGWDDAAIAQRTAELLKLVDLPASYTTRLPGSLSGGQRQRVGVARALAARPKIMLMDEPFGALDPVTRDVLGTQYRQLHEHMAVTTVMVTHDVLEAVLLADRIVMLRAGEIVADGTPRELLHQHTDADVRALMDMPRRQAARVRDLME